MNDLLDRLGPLYRDLDDEIGIILSALDDEGERPVCHRGCSACCSVAVIITVPEARYLAEGIKTLPLAQQGALQARLVAWASQAARAGVLDDPEYGTKGWLKRYLGLKIPCPMLGPDGACEVYPWRPVDCRAHHVFQTAEYCGVPGGQARALDTDAEKKAMLRRLAEAAGSDDGPLKGLKRGLLPLLLLVLKGR